MPGSLSVKAPRRYQLRISRLPRCFINGLERSVKAQNRDPLLGRRCVRDTFETAQDADRGLQVVGGGSSRGYLGGHFHLRLLGRGRVNDAEEKKGNGDRSFDFH